MILDSQEQKGFLLSVLEQAKLSGNYQEVAVLSKRVVDTILIVKKAEIISNTTTETNNDISTKVKKTYPRDAVAELSQVSSKKKSQTSTKIIP